MVWACKNSRVSSPFFWAAWDVSRGTRRDGWLAGIGCAMIIETRCKSDAITPSVLIASRKVSSSRSFIGNRGKRPNSVEVGIEKGRLRSVAIQRGQSRFPSGHARWDGVKNDKWHHVLVWSNFINHFTIKVKDKVSMIALLCESVDEILLSNHLNETSLVAVLLGTNVFNILQNDWFGNWVKFWGFIAGW